MYATAHRVWSRRSDRGGINAFLHRHDRPDDAVDWNAPDLLAVVTESSPGRLVSEVIEVVPGGNEVQSHLDVVAPDDTPPDAIRGALLKAAQELPEGSQRHVKHGDVIVAFDCQIGLRGAERLEFDVLVAALERVVEEGPKPRAVGAPILIRVLVENDALVCRLDEAETARVEALLGHPHERLSVSAAHDVMQDFERLYGDIGPELAHVVTGLTLEQLFAAGGVRFVDALTSRVLRQWPRPRE
jgi:hypothetical protein